MSEIYIKNKYRELNKDKIHVPFEPEHERLNKTPIVMGVKKEDFMPQRTNKKVNIREVAAGSLRSPMEVLSRTPKLSNIPAQVKVNSGRNEDNLWNQEINYDEVQLPPEIENNNETDHSSVVSIGIGEYVLFYDDSLIVTGSIEEISSTIEEYLLDDNNDLELDRFSVFKKMNIKTGVLISNE